MTMSRPQGFPAPPKKLDGLESLTWLMDQAIRVPGTRYRVGADAILGLLPIGGDVLTGVVQVGIVAAALYQYKVPKVVAARMATNVLIDVIVGAVPFVGDLFDVVFKANTRNLKLLNEVRALQEADKPVPTAGSKIFLALVVLGLLSVVFLVFAGFVAVATWLLNRPWV